MSRTAARDLLTLGETVEAVSAPIPTDVQARARLVVAAHARDGADCRMLLDLLGLTPVENAAGADTPDRSG